MQAFDKDAILERKQQLMQALQEVADEYQRLQGAIQLCDAMLGELEQPQEIASGEEPPRNDSKDS